MNAAANELGPRERALFVRALELAPTERAEFLAEACAGDAPLLRRLEALLGRFEQLDTFLEKPAVSAGDQTRRIFPGHSPENIIEKPGACIGRYKLLQKIGEGGCGVVYMAEQEEPVRRRVALKIIKLGMDTKSVIARFEAERQALALMDHPNIAKVFDAGATESRIPDSEGRARHSVRAETRMPDSGAQRTDAPYQDQPALPAGRPYFVMELVRGVKITDYCDEKNLATRERLELFGQVCHAVQHAHQKGIIHRDIKPSNILVTVNDGVPIPKVIDFGIAKATTDQRLTDKTVFTAFEQFIGTPAYMSPEQAEITSVDIDTRSDIYSLGVLLYELLTGKTPFDAGELLQAGLDEMRRTLREKEPERPSTRVSTLAGEELTTTAKRRGLDAPKLVNLLRGDLDWIVMKCLEKDRARRYETANGLANDIQRHLSNEPVVACPPSKVYRFQKMVRRNKGAFAAGAGITAALIIGLAIALWQSLEKTRAYGKSQQVAQFLKDMLQDLGPSVTTGRDPTIVRELLDRAAIRIDRDLLTQPETAIELRTVLAATYGELGFFHNMEELAHKNLAIAKSFSGEETLAVANALSQIGQAKFCLGEKERAETLTRQALRIRRKLLGNYHLDVARSLKLLGDIIRRPMERTGGEAAYREGLAICESQGESTVLADLLDGLAVDVRFERPGEAEILCRRALEVRRKLLGEHSSVVGTLIVLGMILAEQGKFAEAKTYNMEALTMSQKLFGKDHLLVAKAESGLAGVLAAEGNLPEAEALLNRAVATQRKVYGNENMELAYTLSSLGNVCERAGKFMDAENNYRESLAIRTKLNPTTAVPLGLSRVLRKQGKLQEAKSTFREAIKALQLDADKGNSPFLQNQLAWLLATWPEAEFRDGPREVACAEKAVTATGRTNATYLDTLAAAYAEAGDSTRAVTVQKEAMALLHTKAEQNDYASRLKLYESGSAYHERE